MAPPGGPNVLCRARHALPRQSVSTRLQLLQNSSFEVAAKLIGHNLRFTCQIPSFFCLNRDVQWKRNSGVFKLHFLYPRSVRMRACGPDIELTPCDPIKPTVGLGAMVMLQTRPHSLRHTSTFSGHAASHSPIQRRPGLHSIRMDPGEFQPQ